MRPLELGLIGLCRLIRQRRVVRLTIPVRAAQCIATEPKGGAHTPVVVEVDRGQPREQSDSPGNDELDEDQDDERGDGRRGGNAVQESCRADRLPSHTGRLVDVRILTAARDDAAATGLHQSEGLAAPVPGGADQPVSWLDDGYHRSHVAHSASSSMNPAGPARPERRDGADRGPDRGAATVYINKRRSPDV